jgi:uncharacterized protein YkwD
LPVLTRITLCSSAGAALVALVLAAPVEAADCRGLEDARAVVCEVNDVRADRGLEALGTDRRLQRAAEAHARDMVRRDFFSHVTPEGATVSDRLRESDYITGSVAWRVGEALAWGRNRLSTPAATVTAWLRSPPHRRIVLGRYREIGIGVAGGDPFGGPGTTYTADFGLLGR